MPTTKPPGLSRRKLLQWAGLGGLSVVSGCSSESSDALLSDDPNRRSEDVFRHGVASGEPLPDGVILWTRVTPDDTALPGSGRGPDVTVTWELATDETFNSIRQSGTLTARTARDHTVQVDVRGLSPAQQYWYLSLIHI